MGVADLRPGDPRQIGRYTIVGLLGAGGMGAVYLGRMPDQQLVAIKVLRSELAGDSGLRARFRREGHVLTQISGDAVVRVLEVAAEADPPYMVTEYIDGPSLAEHVARSGPLAPGRIGWFAGELAHALNTVHAAGVVHRDLKPGNVILAETGPKVIDFGIASTLDATALTSTGVVLGSPGFMAPEQVAGTSTGPATDVFAWALTVAYAATGRPPFGAGPVEAIFYRIRQLEPDIDGVPVPLEPLLRLALAKEPASRPSAAQLVAALSAFSSRNFASGRLPSPQALASTVPATFVPAAAAAGRRRLGIAAVAVLVVAIGVTAALTQIPRGNTPSAGATGSTTDSPSSHGTATTAPAVPPAAASTSSAPATQDLGYEPFTMSGLSESIVPTKVTSGSCFTGSGSAPSRADAYRCMDTASDLYDPCFINSFDPADLRAVCVEFDPKHVVILKMTSPPAPPATTFAGPVHPWLIELSNGLRCAFNTGTSGGSGQQRPNYICGVAGESGWLYGFPNTSNAVWTIEYQAPNSANAVPTDIEAAYK